MQNRKMTETIAAVATAMSSSGIGIIRVSGETAIEIVAQVFSKKNGGNLADVPTHTIHYGWIHDGSEVLDEVLVAVMKGPHSYTAEDTVEIDCHGGILIMKKILELVIRHGARLAEPGEFTKRAFLNGRIDLSQAEAVMDVIQAKNDYAVKSSVAQLGGLISKRIKKLREDLLYEVAYIESALDDPEHVSLDGYREKLFIKLQPMISEIEHLVNSADYGRIISEGIKTVILGKPNVGKSSLMNLLLGEERAIVTSIAGTTRDILEEHIQMNGFGLNVIDTAGIRETDDIIEKIGVGKARDMAEQADLIIYMVDGSCALDRNDEIVMDLVRGKKAVVLLNKTDLDIIVSQEELEEKTGLPVIPISAKEKIGIESFKKVIQQMFYNGEIDFNDELLVTNVRHKMALEDALSSLRLVEDSIKDGMPEDLFTIDLMDAYGQLGMILGESVEDDLVNEIFSKFCMGK